LGEERGPLRHLGTLEGMSATAAQEWTKTGLATPTGTRKQLQLGKIPYPPSMLTLQLTIPKEGVETNPLRLLWLEGHPSDGGGIVPRGRLIEDGRQSFECEKC
jgi:hypothetical protein